MKKIVCEMCESTSFSKEDGMFICQKCGMKYSMEEAKKLMIEVEDEIKTDEPVKVVVVNNELENLYKLARRAKDDNNSENAAKYYEMVAMKDPNSWEAAFYSVYFKAMNCKIAHIASAANSVSNSIASTMELIANHTEGDSKLAAVTEVVLACDKISTMLYTAALNHYNEIDYSIRDNHIGETAERCMEAIGICYIMGNAIEEQYIEDDAFKNVAVLSWKQGMNLSEILKAKGEFYKLGSAWLENYKKKLCKYDEVFAKKCEIDSLIERKTQISDRQQYLRRSCKRSLTLEGFVGYSLACVFGLAGICPLIVGIISFVEYGGDLVFSLLAIPLLGVAFFGYRYGRKKQIAYNPSDEDIVKYTNEIKELDKKLEEIDSELEKMK